MEHLERESRIGVEPTRTCGPASIAANAEVAKETLLDLTSDDEEGGVLSPETQALIRRMIDGTEPIDGELKDHHTEKFSPRQVNMVMLKAAGFKGTEIAAALGCTNVTVSNTVNHPYGRKLMTSLMAARGVRVLDIRTKLDVYAGEILDQMFELTSQSKDLEAVSKVGFGLLDRAGYNATQKVQTVPAERGLASEGTLSRLASALEESQRVDASIMPAYVPKPPPDDGLIESSSPGSTAEVDPLAGGGVRLAKVSG